MIFELVNRTQTENSLKYETFQLSCSEEVDPYIAQVQVQIDNVNKWFGDRLEWVGKIYDQVYREKLGAELMMFRD